MLIPLGILASSGAAAPIVSDYELISTTLISTSTPSVTFSSLGTYSSTYKHLQIRYAVFNSTAYWFALRLNGDTTNANYRTHRLVGNGSTINTGSEAGDPDGMPIFCLYGSSTQPGSGIIDILDAYSTTKNKTLRAFSRNSSDVALSSGLYINTAALTSIELRTQGYELQSGSRISLYGIKG
jgi:hypothetical protein